MEPNSASAQVGLPSEGKATGRSRAAPARGTACSNMHSPHSACLQHAGQSGISDDSTQSARDRQVVTLSNQDTQQEVLCSPVFYDWCAHVSTVKAFVYSMCTLITCSYAVLVSKIYLCSVPLQQQKWWLTGSALQGAHGVWELSVNKVHHADMVEDLLEALVAQLANADTQVQLVCFRITKYLLPSCSALSSMS